MVNGSKQTHDITWFIPGSPGSQWVEKTGSHWFSASHVLLLNAGQQLEVEPVYTFARCRHWAKMDPLQKTVSPAWIFGAARSKSCR